MLDDDKTSSSTYNIRKLNESNYRSWTQQLKWILREKVLLEVVEGTEKAPVAPVANTPSTTIMLEQLTTYDTELATWTKKANKASSIIGSKV